MQICWGVGPFSHVRREADVLKCVANTYVCSRAPQQLLADLVPALTAKRRPIQSPALATVTLAGPQSAAAPQLPACLAARDNLGRQTRGDSNSLSLPHFLSLSLSVSICVSLPVSGLDEVLVEAVHQSGVIRMNLVMPNCIHPYPKSPTSLLLSSPQFLQSYLVFFRSFILFCLFSVHPPPPPPPPSLPPSSIPAAYLSRPSLSGSSLLSEEL